MNRDEAPAVWWSAELGLIWWDDETRSYRYADGDQVRELLALPAHARSYENLIAVEGRCCGECMAA